ncbi:MAG: HNH endonuclease [Candidatus Kariarchaeaceae archaeon]|jgi:hypothetical protein
MWKDIPNYPNYQFNIDTLEVKSLARITSNQYNGKERILKSHFNNGYYLYVLYNEEGQRTLKRSQICWLVYNGNLPPKGIVIDHINENRQEDHIWNLQELTNRENTSKGWINKKRSNYPIGVTLHRKTNTYRSRIKRNNKEICLGYFKTIKEASDVYQNAL